MDSNFRFRTREASDLSFSFFVYVPETVRVLAQRTTLLARGRRFKIPGPAGPMGRTPDHWKTPSPRPNGLMARPGTESSNPSAPSRGVAGSAGDIAWRDRRRLAKKRARAIEYSRGKDSRRQLYRELIAATRATQAALQEAVRGRADLAGIAAERWRARGAYASGRGRCGSAAGTRRGPALHDAIAVEFGFMEPLRSFRRRVDQPGELRFYPVRKRCRLGGTCRLADRAAPRLSRRRAR
jgi:hypothetical protein